MKAQMIEYDTKAEAEVACWPGVTIEGIVTGRKHRRTILRFGDQTRFVISPATCGDSRRGPMRHVTDIRKVLKELGATRQDN